MKIKVLTLLTILAISSLPAFANSLNLQIALQENLETCELQATLSVKANSADDLLLGSGSISLLFNQEVIPFDGYNATNFKDQVACNPNGYGEQIYSVSPPNAFDDDDLSTLTIITNFQGSNASDACPPVGNNEWIEVGIASFEMLSGNRNYQLGLLDVYNTNSFFQAMEAIVDSFPPVYEIDSLEFDISALEGLDCTTPGIFVKNYEQASCNNDNGVIEVEITPTTSPFFVPGEEGTVAEPITYSWSHDDNLNGPLAENLSPGDYTLRIIDANGCSNFQKFQMNANSTTVYSYDGVNSDTLEHGRNSFIDDVSVYISTPTCQLENGSIFILPQNTIDETQISWSHDAQLTESIAGDLDAGTYTITLSHPESLCNEIITIVLADTDDPTFIVQENNPTFPDENTGSLVVGYEGLKGNVSINVVHDTIDLDLDIELTNPITIADLGAGSYDVTFTDAYGCSVSETIVVTEDSTSTDIVNHSSLDLSKIYIHPVPAKDQIQVSFTSSADVIQLEVLDIKGRSVMKKIIKGNRGRLTEILNIRYLADGLYLLKLSQANKQKTVKFMKN